VVAGGEDGFRGGERAVKTSNNEKRNSVQFFASAGIALLFWQFALDPIFVAHDNNKRSIPELTTRVRGVINTPPGFRMDESGYKFQGDEGLNIVVHCGPTPSWDFCLDHSGHEIPKLGTVDLEYYIDRSNPDQRAVIASISKDGNVLVSRGSQLSWQRSFSKHYNSRLGKFVANRIDITYWIVHVAFGIVWVLALGNVIFYLSSFIRNFLGKK
jgi:hypothetical protein